MAIWDLYSKREKLKQRAGLEDVVQYENLPKEFRVQVIHIWADAIGPWQEADGFDSYRLNIEPPNRHWIEIHNALAREKGVFQLSQEGSDPFAKCRLYLGTAETADALDLIELSFLLIRCSRGQSAEYLRRQLGLVHPDEAIAELNGRFREHGIGYEFTDGKIIRVDSKYLHAETVKPALHLLRDGGKGFTGPLDEFLSAHDHHRKGEQKEAIADALKAFESTLKAICAARRWPFDPHKDTAKQLIEIVFNHGLIPSYLQQQFSALRSVLESGVPTVRNKTSGHGQGATPTTVPDYLAAYALHLAASNIVLLVEAHKAMPI